MSAGFTPGPWLVHSTNRLVCQADGAFKPVTVKDGKVDGDDLPNNICLLRDPGEGFTEDETLANGFLIAAAPELYEALVAIHDMLWGRPDIVKALRPLMGFAEDAISERCAAALAKARGVVA